MCASIISLSLGSFGLYRNIRNIRKKSITWNGLDKSMMDEVRMGIGQWIIMKFFDEMINCWLFRILLRTHFAFINNIRFDSIRFDSLRTLFSLQANNDEIYKSLFIVFRLNRWILRGFNEKNTFTIQKGQWPSLNAITTLISDQ